MRRQLIGPFGLWAGLGALSAAAGAQPAAPAAGPPAEAPAGGAAAPPLLATTPPATTPPTASAAAPAPPSAVATASPVPAPPLDCRRSDGCRQYGLCTAYAGRCVATTDAECAWSNGCRTRGLCHAELGQCTTDRCRRSKDCRDKGRCVTSEKGCIAAAPADCRAARICIEDGACFLSRDRKKCTDGTRHRSTGALIGGAISLGVGGVALLGGSALLVVSETYECDSLVCAYDERDLDMFRTMGITMLIVGGTAASVGIPLLIYGAPKEADESAVQSVSAWQPALRVGPTGGSVRFPF